MNDETIIKEIIQKLSVTDLFTKTKTPDLPQFNTKILAYRKRLTTKDLKVIMVGITECDLLKKIEEITTTCENELRARENKTFSKRNITIGVLSLLLAGAVVVSQINCP